MVEGVVVAESRTLAVPPEQAYDAVMPAPLDRISRHRFIAIPRIREVRDQQGVWSSVGGGTQVTWSLAVQPAKSGRLLMPVFSWLWRGYARRALGEIEALLPGS